MKWLKSCRGDIAVHLIQWNLRREEMQKYAVDKNSENLQKPLKQSVLVCYIIAFHILNRMILSTCRRNAVPLLSKVFGARVGAASIKQLNSLQTHVRILCWLTLMWNFQYYMYWALPLLKHGIVLFKPLSRFPWILKEPTKSFLFPKITFLSKYSKF